MTDPFNDPEVLCLSVPALRRYWALLLQDCAEKHAQEHPLYALFSSILSTLSKAVSVSGGQVSPMSADGSIIFSYPQCRIVVKKAASDSEWDSMSAYPDFGLMHHTIEQSPNGGTKVERVKLLIEIKRLYYTDKTCLWIDQIKLLWAVEDAIYANIRQLLLQAYCAFGAYKQPEVFIMLVPGVYFTLLKFRRPNFFEPLSQAPAASSKKRKLVEVGETDSERPECQAAREMSNSQLIDLIPLEFIEVIHHGAPVFADVKAQELHLSDAFRHTLHMQLDDVDFQPCSLFDLHTAQHMPGDRGQGEAMSVISKWYFDMGNGSAPKTPERPGLHPYAESPIKEKDVPISPEYKGKASSEVGHRKSLQRKSKDRTNLLRSWAGGDGSEEGALGAAGGVGSSHLKGSGDSDGEDEGEDWQGSSDLEGEVNEF